MTNKTTPKLVADALLDMIWQHCSGGDKIYDIGLSSNEDAFYALGLKNGMTYEQSRTQVDSVISAMQIREMTVAEVDQYFVDKGVYCEGEAIEALAKLGTIRIVEGK